MMRVELDLDMFSIWKFIIREMFKIVTCTLKHDYGSISTESMISLEPFWNNFHIIFKLQDPKTVDL